MSLADKVTYSGGGNVVPAIDRPRLGKVELADGLLFDYVPDPLPIALGCTFSPELCAAVAKADAKLAFEYEEAFAGTVPCGLIRDPMRASAAGLFSEDAFVVAELLKGYTPVGGLGFVFTDCLGQERFTDRTIDMRALREMYLYPLMRAGNYAAGLQLDGGYLNGNRVCSSGEVYELMTRYIPESAPVFTQYGDVPEVEKMYGNGTYILGIDGNFKRDVMLNVKWGIIIESKINSAIERMLSFALDTHDRYVTPDTKAFDGVDGYPELTRQCSVLLKNDGLLPTPMRSMTFFGDPDAFEDSRHYELHSVKNAQNELGAVNVFFITGYENDGIDAVTASAVMGSIATSKTVLVICGGCAVELGQMAKADAVLFCPNADFLADIMQMLTDGNSAPQGHLPFTWAASAESYPCNNKKFAARGDFRYESLYNGHLLFDNFASEVLYPFGHGLDYTDYSVSKLKLYAKGQKLTAEFIVKNTGSNCGTVLLQAYLTLIDAPVYGINKRLVAFKKIKLDPTENTGVVMEIDISDVAVYDETYDTFITAGGRYRVDIGLSSMDIRATDEIKVAAASRVAVGLSNKLAPAYYAAGKGESFAPTAPEIERLLKVPFIKRPDEHPELNPPSDAFVKKALKKIRKATGMSAQILKYKIAHTPEKNSDM